MSNIVLFTLDGCYHCESLKKRLNKINIPFYELEITKNPEIWEKVTQQITHEYLPTIFITNDNDDEGLIFVPTIDYQSEDEIIKIIKDHT